MRPTCHRYLVEGWGVGEIWALGDVLLAHDLPSPRPGPPSGGARPPADSVPEPGARRGDGIVAELERRVRRHLAGEPVDYADLPLDLSAATPFGRALVAAVRAVPWGEVVAYGELAARSGRPRAARAAGTFCAGNPFALVVPCHRVVAADGIGGYGATGVATKRRLLALEGVRR